ncbi:hypothetical protein O1M63_04120 [Streptomyces mirabilis]|nr:hypothetical protein [Streptomyces mirabilis]
MKTSIASNCSSNPKWVAPPASPMPHLGHHRFHVTPNVAGDLVELRPGGGQHLPTVEEQISQ